MLKIILILLAIVVLISVLLVLILFQLGKRPDPNKSHNEQESYYDENGNPRRPKSKDRGDAR